MVDRPQKALSIGIRYLADRQDVLPVVAGWIFREWSFLYADKTRQHVENFLRQRLHKRKLPLTLVAFEKDRPVGTVSLKNFDLEERPDLPWWVTSLYVLPRWRRKGIGSCLMTAAVEKAARVGIPRLFLFTADPGLAARFYSGLGWTIREKRIYRSYPVVIMEKDLRAFKRRPREGWSECRATGVHKRR